LRTLAGEPGLTGGGSFELSWAACTAGTWDRVLARAEVDAMASQPSGLFMLRVVAATVNVGLAQNPRIEVAEPICVSGRLHRPFGP
jgi:hypothetical protein